MCTHRTPLYCFAFMCKRSSAGYDSEAQEAFKGGKLEDAVAKAKTAEIMTKLGMTLPPTAKS